MGYYLLLRTGTLSWEDVENKADYKAGGMGIAPQRPRPYAADEPHREG